MRKISACHYTRCCHGNGFNQNYKPYFNSTHSGKSPRGKLKEEFTTFPFLNRSAVRRILVPRAHDHSDLRQGSRALARPNLVPRAHVSFGQRQDTWALGTRLGRTNLVPRGPSCHALEISGPLARPNDIPVLNGYVNTVY